MGVNKVVYGGETLIDITDSTVTPETLGDGAVAYGADGEQIVGRMVAGVPIDVYEDENGNIVVGGITSDGSSYPYVTPEMYGAVGDGVTDDADAFARCIASNKVILLPFGKEYMVTALPTDVGFVIKGGCFHSEYVPSDIMPKLKGISMDGGNVFGESKTFENIELVNCSIMQMGSIVVNKCQLRNSTLKTLRGGRITDCYFNNCEIAIDGLVDSMVTNCTFTECGICCRNGSSSHISGNRFQWSNVGISLAWSQDLIITDNWFDRNDKAIIMTVDSEVSITGNVFKRSVESHISGAISNCVLNDNKFIWADSSDDGAGTLVPASCFDVTSLNNTTIVGNKFLYKTDAVKLFSNRIGVRTDTNAIYGNLVDNKPLEARTKTTSFTAQATNTFQLDNLIERGFYASAIEYTLFYNGGFFATPNVEYRNTGVVVSCPAMTVGNNYQLHVRIIYRDISVL